MISEALRTVEEQAQALLDSVTAQAEAIRRNLQLAAKDWPDHQMVRGVRWHSREETPPLGMVWASDGSHVWIIHTDGAPIHPRATAVKWWTHAFIPAPPDANPDLRVHYIEEKS